MELRAGMVMIRQPIGPLWLNRCAPVALSRLLGLTYKGAVRRIHAAGGDYRSATADVFQRLLAPYGIIQELFFRPPETFQHWRPATGYWVIIATTNCAESGHCIALKDGAALDNGWVMEGDYIGRLASVRVHAAWQIESLALPASIMD